LFGFKCYAQVYNIMVDINLITNESSSGQKVPYKWGMFAIIGIIIALVIAYLWIHFTLASTTAKIEASNNAYQSEADKLVKGDGKKVVDFKNRLDLAKDLINRRNFVFEGLNEMEKDLIPNSFLTRYQFDDAKQMVSVEGQVNNLNVLAKQLSSFKKSSYFSGVTLKNSSVEDDGKVFFGMDLKIK
jgi:hypothetical protein